MNSKQWLDQIDVEKSPPSSFEPEDQLEEFQFEQSLLKADREELARIPPADKRN